MGAHWRSNHRSNNQEASSLLLLFLQENVMSLSEQESFSQDDQTQDQDWTLGLLGYIQKIAQFLQTTAQGLFPWLHPLYCLLVFPLQLVLYGGIRLAAALKTNLALPVVTRYGSKMLCHFPDSIQACIFLYGVWEPDISAFIVSEMAPTETFIDVGCHVGYHALLACEMVGAEGRVVAIEASPRTFLKLQENLKLNPKSSNIRALNVAVTETQGLIPLYLGAEGIEGWSSTIPHRSLSEECVISGEPLSTLLTAEELRTARMIKIDVEGAEAAALRGMVPILDQLRDDVLILIELTPLLWPEGDRAAKMTHEQVLSPFLERGFYPYHIHNNYGPWRFLNPDRVARPQRIHGAIRGHRLTGQIDLVLSKQDAEYL